MKIYFAGPLFSQAELNYNRALAEKLESLNFKVFLPQRDGVEKDRSPYLEMKPEERRKAIFEMDRDNIFTSDIFLFVLDGRVPDEGACVELGMAYAQRYFEKNKKVIIGIQTDSRAAFLGSKLNPMLKIPLDFIASNEEELINFLSSI